MNSPPSKTTPCDCALTCKRLTVSSMQASSPARPSMYASHSLGSSTSRRANATAPANVYLGKPIDLNSSTSSRDCVTGEAVTKRAFHIDVVLEGTRKDPVGEGKLSTILDGMEPANGTSKQLLKFFLPSLANLYHIQHSYRKLQRQARQRDNLAVLQEHPPRLQKQANRTRSSLERSFRSCRIRNKDI